MKPFKTLEEQHDILLKRGLSFQNDISGKQYLLLNNYYSVINGYSKFFLEDGDNFIEGTKFDEITMVHYFDKEIKSTLFNYIIEAERHFKAVISHRFSEKYKDEPYAYLRTTSYNHDSLLEVAKHTSVLSNVIQRYGKDKHPNSIKHYLNNHTDVPLWVLSGYLTFGQVVKFYTLLEPNLKNQIAKDLSNFLSENLGSTEILASETLEVFLHNIVEVRNIVAHNNKLLGHKCKKNTKYLKKLHEQYGIQNNSPRQDVYNVIINMQCLLTKNQYSKLHNTLLKRTKNLNNNLHTISCNKIIQSLGFPADWHLTTSKLNQG